MGRVTNPVADGSRGRPEARNESAFFGQNVVPMQITLTCVAVIFAAWGVQPKDSIILSEDSYARVHAGIVQNAYNCSPIRLGDRVAGDRRSNALRRDACLRRGCGLSFKHHFVGADLSAFAFHSSPSAAFSSLLGGFSWTCLQVPDLGIGG